MNYQINNFAHYLPNSFEPISRTSRLDSNVSSSPDIQVVNSLPSEFYKLPPLHPNSQINVPLPSIGAALYNAGAKPKPNSTTFISLFNEAASKRPRRKHHEVNRIYQCSFPGCNKSYGALNHLNAHILAQNHGTKRKACEFKHLI